jgi:hypothetical protein
MTVAPYRVHKLIQDLMRDPVAAAAFAADAEPTFEKYALTEGEKRMLRDGSPAALHELGVHPNLQMKYVRLRASSKQPGPGLLDAYLDKLMER